MTGRSGRVGRSSTTGGGGADVDDRRDRRVNLLHLGHELQAVDIGHLVIGDDHAHVEARYRPEGVGRLGEAVDGTRQVVAEQLLQQVDVGELVINQEDEKGTRYRLLSKS